MSYAKERFESASTFNFAQSDSRSQSVRSNNLFLRKLLFQYMLLVLLSPGAKRSSRSSEPSRTAACRRISVAVAQVCTSHTV